MVSFENTLSLAFIDLTRLPNLSKFTYRNSSSGNLDLTQNKKLRYLALISSNITEIQLSGNAGLNSVYIESVFLGGNKVISEVYENTAANNITGGSITLVNQTITESSRQILRDLQSKYNWTVTILNNAQGS